MAIKHVETVVRSSPSNGLRRGNKVTCLCRFLVLQFD